MGLATSRLALASVLLVVCPLAASSARQEPAPSALTEISSALADSDPARAWAALPRLRALKVDAKDKKLAQKLVATWTDELRSSQDVSVRVIRAHALAAMHDLGLQAAPALVEVMGDAPAQVRLACALGLAEMGPDADKAIAKGIRPAELLGGALCCAALARAGEPSAAGLKVLKGAVEEVETFRALILSEAALATLETLEQDVAKVLQVRERKQGRIGVPVTSALNWHGVLEQKPESFFAFFKESLALEQPASLQAYAMPDALRPIGRTQFLFDLYAGVLAHLTRLPRELLPGLQDGSIGSWDGYTKRVQPWVYTLDLLARVEQRFVPEDEKGK